MVRHQRTHTCEGCEYLWTCLEATTYQLPMVQDACCGAEEAEELIGTGLLQNTRDDGVMLLHNFIMLGTGLKSLKLYMAAYMPCFHAHLRRRCTSVRSSSHGGPVEVVLSIDQRTQ